MTSHIMLVFPRTLLKIARGLEADGILNGAGNEKWHTSNINNNANRDELKKRMADMSTFLKKQTTALTEYDEQLVRRMIEKFTINEDKFTVEFKSGLTVNVDE